MSEHQQTQQSKKADSTFQKQAALTSQKQVSHPASIIQRARINPKSLTAADVLQLQRTIGNRAVGRLLSEIRNPSKVQQVPIQRQIVPDEEEPLQGKMIETVLRKEISEEEETLQGKFETIQRQEPEEDEKLQMKSVVQRQEIPEEEETLQGKMADPVQLQEIPEEEEPIQGKMIGTIQRQEIPEEEPLQKKSENNTGMPDNLKAGVESLSGIDMSDVRVHYNSDKPAQVGALAHTQGTNIHVAPGQERHLPHEAWHVVQQAQGRVKPTMQLKGVAVNDDERLEQEADVMGKAVQEIKQKNDKSMDENINSSTTVQKYIDKHGVTVIQKAKVDIKGPDGEQVTGYSGNDDVTGNLITNSCIKNNFSEHVKPKPVNNQVRSPYHCAEPNALAKIINNNPKKVGTTWLRSLQFPTATLDDGNNPMSPCPVCEQWVIGMVSKVPWKINPEIIPQNIVSQHEIDEQERRQQQIAKDIQNDSAFPLVGQTPKKRKSKKK